MSYRRENREEKDNQYETVVKIPVSEGAREACLITQLLLHLISHQELVCTGCSTRRGKNFHSNMVSILRCYIVVVCHCLLLMGKGVLERPLINPLSSKFNISYLHCDVESDVFLTLGQPLSQAGVVDIGLQLRSTLNL
jgi:hypothetical protein